MFKRMIYFYTISIILGVGVLITTANLGAKQSKTENKIAFVNVNVIPMDTERVLNNQTVVVHFDRIIELGPSHSVKVPDNALQIDGSGKFLLPGLAEMHGHLPGIRASDEDIEKVLFLYAANGVTTVRGMLGQPNQLELKTKTNSGKLFAPTLYLAGPSFNNRTVESSEQGAQRVRDQKAEGWDLLKIHPGLTLDQYDAIATTAAEVGIRFGGHVPADVGLLHAIQMGQETFDHLDGFIQFLDAFDKPIENARLQHIVQLTKSANAWVVPTLVLWRIGIIGLEDAEDLSKLAELKYWPQESRPGVEGVKSWGTRQGRAAERRKENPSRAEQWDKNRMTLLKALNDGGVGILMGTDSPQIFSVPGFSLHNEMAAMSESGLTPYEILKSGTKNVGDYFQRYDSFGTIAVGKRADLILVNENPLDNIANVKKRVGVMIRGRWMSEVDIQKRLQAIASSWGN